MKRKDFNIYGSDIDLSGIKIAKVIGNKDPKGLERVLISVLGVHDIDNASLDNSIWADRIAFSKYASGDIPDVNDYIYVVFPDPTNPMTCLWIGWVRGMRGV